MQGSYNLYEHRCLVLNYKECNKEKKTTPLYTYYLDYRELIQKDKKLFTFGTRDKRCTES